MEREALAERCAGLTHMLEELAVLEDRLKELRCALGACAAVEQAVEARWAALASEIGALEARLVELRVAVLVEVSITQTQQLLGQLAALRE
jgi:hypothetical protein